MASNRKVTTQERFKFWSTAAIIVALLAVAVYGLLKYKPKADVGDTCTIGGPITVTITPVDINDRNNPPTALQNIPFTLDPGTPNVQNASSQLAGFVSFTYTNRGTHTVLVNQDSGQPGGAQGQQWSATYTDNGTTTYYFRFDQNNPGVAQLEPAPAQAPAARQGNAVRRVNASSTCNVTLDGNIKLSDKPNLDPADPIWANVSISLTGLNGQTKALIVGKGATPKSEWPTGIISATYNALSHRFDIRFNYTTAELSTRQLTLYATLEGYSPTLQSFPMGSKQKTVNLILTRAAAPATGKLSLTAIDKNNQSISPSGFKGYIQEITATDMTAAKATCSNPSAPEQDLATLNMPTTSGKYYCIGITTFPSSWKFAHIVSDSQVLTDPLNNNRSTIRAAGPNAVLNTTVQFRFEPVAPPAAQRGTITVHFSDKDSGIYLDNKKMDKGAVAYTGTSLGNLTKIKEENGVIKELKFSNTSTPNYTFTASGLVYNGSEYAVDKVPNPIALKADDPEKDVVFVVHKVVKTTVNITLTNDISNKLAVLIGKMEKKSQNAIPSVPLPAALATGDPFLLIIATMKTAASQLPVGVVTFHTKPKIDAKFNVAIDGKTVGTVGFNTTSTFSYTGPTTGAHTITLSAINGFSPLCIVKTGISGVSSYKDVRPIREQIDTQTFYTRSETINPGENSYTFLATQLRTAPHGNINKDTIGRARTIDWDKVQASLPIEKKLPNNLNAHILYCLFHANDENLPFE